MSPRCGRGQTDRGSLKGSKMNSKIRVFELARDLNIPAKELVQKLSDGGLDVKSHANSVFVDEAKAILKKSVGVGAGGSGGDESQKSAKRRPGMMIVRKRTKAPSEELATAPEVVAEVKADEPVAPTVVAEAPVIPEVPRADEAMVAAVETAVPAEDSVDAAAPAVEAVSVGEQSAEPTASIPDEVSQDADSGKVEDAGASKSAAGAESGDKPVSRPGDQGGAQVVRMIDRDKLAQRVPGRRLGGGPSGGGNRFGQVTELKVVSDPFGRGREMVAVGKDKKGRGKGQKGRGPTKREMMQMRERSMQASRLRRKKTTRKSRSDGPRQATRAKAEKRVIRMAEAIIIADLAHQLGVKAQEVIRLLIGMGTMATVNQEVDFDTATLIATEFEFTVESNAFSEDDLLETVPEEEEDHDLESRPPVVTIMGHVDHGKTSLLDAIRSTRVAAKEAGGITQHIGAYSAEVKGKGTVTFIDTPGHAAFTEMRARGAQVTDIVVLVVAADDGVMPQTEEAIKHAQAAGVPIIVAVNKCDLEGARPERVTQELTKFELVPEAWGGDTLFVETSALKGQGVDELLEAILLQSDLMELQANPNRDARGTVIEAKLDKGRGPVATVLVQSGSLSQGDYVVVGQHAGKARALTDYQGKRVKVAGPSMAVEIIGLDGVPAAGDSLNQVSDIDKAREIAEHREFQNIEVSDGGGEVRKSLEDLMRQLKEGEALDLKLVIKSDVQGSTEALKGALAKLNTEEVKVSVVYGGVGGITESDIMLAAASSGLVLGFNVRPDGNARTVAEREKVDIRTYSVIYELIDDVRKAMEGMLEPEIREKVMGRAEVRELFKVSKIGSVAGCRVVEGKAMRSAKVRILRDSIEVHSGKVGSLFHFKDSVREVDTGLECGVSLENYGDVKISDVIEFFVVEEIARTLESVARV